MSFPTQPAAPPSGRDDQSDFNLDMQLLGDEGDGTPQAGDDEDTPQSGDEEPLDDSTDTDEEDGEEGDEEGEDEDEEPSDEDKEDKDDEEEGDDKPLAPVHTRPTVKQINEKYPGFFKQFPEMRHMLFREQEYSQLFPTVDDAKDAASRAGDFDTFSNLLQSGKKEDFQEFLKGVSEAGPKTLRGMAANFLPSLYTTNRDLYFEVTTPIAESLLKNAYKTAKAAGNVNLQNAAEHIALWALGDAGFATGEKSTPPLQVEESPKDPELEKERTAFYQEKYQDARNFVGQTSHTRLEKEFRKGLDPNGVFNSFTSGLLVKKGLEELGEMLEKDTQHIATMNSLWNQAKKAGYVGNWKDRLLATYLSRARTYLPAVRQRLRNEALKGQEQRHEKTRDIAGRSGNRKEVQGSGNAPKGGRQGGNAPANPGTIDWRKTSDLDILNDKVTYRK
jgi:hypothetical protein